jgi:ABC-2 type transport system ATP-binding protein
METRDLIKGLAGDHTIILSTHILPEVAQTCQRVVIINKGRVVAIDTPGNLTRQLKGAASLYVQVDAAGADISTTLSGIAGVKKVAVTEQHEGVLSYEVEGEANHDVRRHVAQAVVNKGWGLLELRPTRVSLEDVFLQLTTEEQPAAEAPNA